MTRRVFVLGGATASGKTALAIDLARRLNGVVVNADSVQLYRDLPTLTARPSVVETAAAPHALYGVLSPDAPASVAAWLDLAVPAIEAAWRGGRLPILTGGTGLYLHALLHGLAPVPAVPAAVRDGVRALPAATLHARLAVEDPVMAARLAPNDAQRIARALEVVRATGRSLDDWQADPPSRPLLNLAAAGVVLLPARAVLRCRIEARMAAMLRGGAVDEVADLGRRVGDPLALPIGKTHGLLEILQLLDGAIDAETAVARASIRIGQYAKRQSTWFRRQLPELVPVDALGGGPAALEAALSALGAGAAASGRGG